MDEWECVLNEREYLTGVFGLSDIAVYCSTYNLFRYVMVSTWRNQYPNISCLSIWVCFSWPHLTNWRCRCSEEACLKMTFTNTGLAAAVREGGQIDVRVDPTFVTVLVEYMNRFECRQIDLLPRMWTTRRKRLSVRRRRQQQQWNVVQ